MTDMTDDMREFLTKSFTDAYDQGLKDGLETVVEVIKEMRPAIRSLAVMGKPMTTEEWFDTLAAAIKEKIK
jgi:hypothetical protein